MPSSPPVLSSLDVPCEQPNARRSVLIDARCKDRLTTAEEAELRIAGKADKHVEPPRHVANRRHRLQS